MNRTMLIVAGAVLVIGVALWLGLRRPRSAVGSYSDVRRRIIDEVAAQPSPAAPARPANLDTRLPTSTAEELRRLGPASQANWKEHSRLYDQVMESIGRELRAIDPDLDWYQLLSPGRRAVVLIANLENEVSNGGFDQYYLNSSGDGAAATPESLRLLGLDQLAEMVEQANAQFPGGPPSDRRQRLAQLDRLPKTAGKVWDELDRRFYDLPGPFGGFAESAGTRYMLAHPAEFFKP